MTPSVGVLLLLTLGVGLVFHELGHALAARLLGVPIHRFTLGLGPTLLTRWSRRGTQVVLKLLPAWASAELEGPDDDAPARPVWRRVVVLLAGPLASAAFAYALLFGLYLAGTHVPVPLTVGVVMPGMEAARAGLRPGDLVRAVDGEPVASWSELVARIDGAPGRDLGLELIRDGSPVEVRVRPRPSEDGGGRIGISQQYVLRTHSAREAVGAAWNHVVRTSLETVQLAIRFGSPLPGTTTRLGVPRQVMDAATTGVDAVVRAQAAVSLLLGLFHLLPIPPLDAGALVFLAVEARRQRRIRPGVRIAIQLTGFLVLGVALVGLALRAAS